MRAKLNLRNYLNLSTLPTPPPTADYSKLAMPSLRKIYLNATYGCHDAQTEVLTERGWQGWPDYDGSLLGTMNRLTGMLEFQQPSALVRYDYDGPLHFAGHKSLDFGLTPNHRMWNAPYVIPYPYTPSSAGYGPYQFDEI